MIPVTSVIASSTTHENLVREVETVAASEVPATAPGVPATKRQFWTVKNKHTTWVDIQCFVLERKVTVCSHSTVLLAQQCIDGSGCAFGTPVGKLN
jgi:hypothetical protein